jgi:mannose-6-phosphate isomerase-like protein (cupin superfamily)
MYNNQEADTEYKFLEQAAEIIRNHNIILSEEILLNLLQIKYRWPKGSVEVINQMAVSSNRFYCEERFLIFNEWKKLYDLGFTSILCNILDLTPELRNLDEKLLGIKGSYTNANLYFSQGSKNHRVSFPIHDHDYHVIVKGIYGTTLWLIKGQQIKLEAGSVIILPAGTPHAVIESTEPRLTLTMNLSG